MGYKSIYYHIYYLSYIFYICFRAYIFLLKAGEAQTLSSLFSHLQPKLKPLTAEQFYATILGCSGLFELDSGIVVPSCQAAAVRELLHSCDNVELVQSTREGDYSLQGPVKVLQYSLAETQESWKIEVQQVVIFADNVSHIGRQCAYVCRVRQQTTYSYDQLYQFFSILFHYFAVKKKEFNVLQLFAIFYNFYNFYQFYLLLWNVC